MSLEKHGSKHYFYYVRRVSGKLVKRYGGAGDAAITAARELEEARQKVRQQRAQTQAADRQLLETCRTLSLVTEAVLANEGVFQHHRGAWRRKHARNSSHI